MVSLTPRAKRTLAGSIAKLFQRYCVGCLSIRTDLHPRVSLCIDSEGDVADVFS